MPPLSQIYPKSARQRSQSFLVLFFKKGLLAFCESTSRPNGKARQPLLQQGACRAVFTGEESHDLPCQPGFPCDTHAGLARNKAKTRCKAVSAIASKSDLGDALAPGRLPPRFRDIEPAVVHITQAGVPQRAERLWGIPPCETVAPRARRKRASGSAHRPKSTSFR